METANTVADEPVGGLIEMTIGVIEQANEYGLVIFKSLILFSVSLIFIFLIREIASRFIYPHLENRRLAKVFFGTVYILIFVVCALLALNINGFDVSGIAQIMFSGILLGAVIIYLLLPFFPKRPFELGHIVQVDDVLGTVETISPAHTTIQKSDGTMVFIPTTRILASKIVNYHSTPTRRIEVSLVVKAGSDIDVGQSILLGIMKADERVLDDPAPPSVIIQGVSHWGVEMAAHCWVKNADWPDMQNDLWKKAVKAFNEDSHLTLP